MIPLRVLIWIHMFYFCVSSNIKTKSKNFESCKYESCLYIFIMCVFMVVCLTC
jgi:hypothetical protein